MNDEKNRRPENQEGNSSTVTVTESEEITETNSEEQSEDPLSPEEEKVIRMLYGKSLKGQEALEFATGASMETSLKLALIEASLLEAFEAGALEPDPQTGAPRSVLTEKLGNE